MQEEKSAGENICIVRLVWKRIHSREFSRMSQNRSLNIKKAIHRRSVQSIAFLVYIIILSVFMREVISLIPADIEEA